jgi:hypothetical protein
VLDANGLYALFKPSAGVMRPDNNVQFAVMFLGRGDDYEARQNCEDRRKVTQW